MIPLDQNGTANVVAATAGPVAVTATASDPSGNQSQLTESLLVADPNDVNCADRRHRLSGIR